MNSTDKLLNSNCNEHRITISGSNEEKTVLILLNASNDSTKIVKKKKSNCVTFIRKKLFKKLLIKFIVFYFSNELYFPIVSNFLDYFSSFFLFNDRVDL